MDNEQKCPDCPPVGAPAWMSTYGDMVTLLLTFFVALMGMKVTETQQIQLILSSFDNNLGNLSGGNSLSPGVLTEMGSSVEMLPSTTKGQSLSRFKQQISDLFKPEIKSTKVRIDETTKGYKIVLATDFFFKPASANIDYAEGVDILRKIAFALKDGPTNTRFEVIGHTDAGSIKPGSYLSEKFPSNWELSAGRSATIVRYLIDFGLAPERFFVEGRSEYEPIESNNTPEGRAYNRRVEIFVSLDRDRKQ
ncbi:MAG: OmpA family protein [Brevinema sp.]